MSRLWDLIARAVTAAIFGPIDRTVCAFANRTHHH